MKNIPILLKITIVISLFVLFAFASQMDSLPEKLKIASKVVSKVSDEFENKYNIRFCGIGWGSDTNELLNLIAVCIETQGEKSKEEIRNILVEFSLAILDEINKNENLKMYLVNNKFDLSNIKINFFINSEDNGELYDPAIGLANFYHGKIRYVTFDSQEKILTIKHEFEETYEAAMEKMKENS